MEPTTNSLILKQAVIADTELRELLAIAAKEGAYSGALILVAELIDALNCVIEAEEENEVDAVLADLLKEVE